MKAKPSKRKLKKEKRGFLDLPAEVVVMIASHLDLTSNLSLAASCNLLLQVLVAQFGAILKRTRMNGDRLDYQQGRAKVKSEENIMTKEMVQLAEFLRFAKDPESKDSLLHSICERFPADPKKEVSVSCERHASGHTVAPFGFILLEKAETIMETGSTPKLKLLAYKGITVDRALLDHISLRVSHQTKKIELDIHNASFGNENSWVRLIGQVKSWRIKTLWIEPDEEDGPYVLEALAGASGRGRIEKLIIRDKVIACGTISQLKKVWSITEEWEVSCSYCEEETLVKVGAGWRRMWTLVENIMARKQEHYKTCGVNH